MLSFKLYILAFMARALQTQLATAAVSYPPRVLDTNVSNQACPLEEQRRLTRNQMRSEIRTIISQMYPCGDPDWTRIAFLNMTNTSNNCPDAWIRVRNQDYPQSCRKRNPNTAGCASVFYNTSGSYDWVCGRMIGYQHGLTQAFLNSTASIDGVYVDGVSVTHGTPRQHIWTFAAGRAETNYLNYSCPCVDGSTNGPNIPAFVGQNYFCEAGVRFWNESQFFSDDPLWDGQGCGSMSSCCTFNSPPWFRVQLPGVTSDSIEVRICHEVFQVPERAAIELLELYIK